MRALPDRPRPSPRARVALIALALLLAPPAPPGARAVGIAAPLGATGTGTYPGSMPVSIPYRPKEFSLVYHDGLFHVFWMRTNFNLPQDSTEKDFGHAISADLTNWTQLATVLPVRPGKWDSDHVWSPSVIRRGATWYMFYTGVTSVPFSWSWYQRIGVATSTDLMNWTREDSPVFTAGMVPWALSDSSTFDGCQFRDGFVMPDPADTTRWLMYYVTTARSARGQLIAAVARSDGGPAPWTDVTPLWCTDLAHYWGWSESPAVLSHDGLWYLFATTNSGHPIRFRTAPGPTADSTLWSGTYRLYDMVGGDPQSDTWFGPEVLHANGTDYFAYVNGYSNSVDIKQIVWNATPPGFTLQNPVVLGVGTRDANGLALAIVGRPERGRGVVLRYALPAEGPARLEVFDVLGRRLATLRQGRQRAGEALAEWDARGPDGAPVAHGVYFARLRTSAGQKVARFALAD